MEEKKENGGGFGLTVREVESLLLLSPLQWREERRLWL